MIMIRTRGWRTTSTALAHGRQHPEILRPQHATRLQDQRARGDILAAATDVLAGETSSIAASREPWASTRSAGNTASRPRAADAGHDAHGLAWLHRASKGPARERFANDR